MRRKGGGARARKPQASRRLYFRRASHRHEKIHRTSSSPCWKKTCIYLLFCCSRAQETAHHARLLAANGRPKGNNIAALHTTHSPPAPPSPTGPTRSLPRFRTIYLHKPARGPCVPTDTRSPLKFPTTMQLTQWQRGRRPVAGIFLPQKATGIIHEGTRASGGQLDPPYDMPRQPASASIQICCATSSHFSLVVDTPSDCTSRQYHMVPYQRLGCSRRIRPTHARLQPNSQPPLSLQSMLPTLLNPNNQQWGGKCRTCAGTVPLAAPYRRLFHFRNTTTSCTHSLTIPNQ